MKRHSYRTLPSALLKKAVRCLYERKECRIHSMDVERIAALPAPRRMRVDSVADLLESSLPEGWPFPAAAFHQMCLQRLEEGTHAYTRVENGKLLHYGWMIERQEISHLSEVDQSFRLPPHSAVLFDYYTHPEARGRGWYRDSLLQGLHDAAAIPGTKHVLVGVLADNRASRHVIEKLGFVHLGSLFKLTRLGIVTKWQVWNDAPDQIPPADGAY